MPKFVFAYDLLVSGSIVIDAPTENVAHDYFLKMNKERLLETVGKQDKLIDIDTYHVTKENE